MTIAEVGKASPLYEFLDDIKGAGERAAGLIRQLLAFSRKQVNKPEVVDLNEMAGNMERMLRRIIREDIELKTILSPDLGLVETDVGQMEQILMNLAVNARDAMPEGGKLTIETSNVELDKTYARNHIAVIPGPYVMLAVSDTGTGMTKEVQARIFEPFFTTKDKSKGTGLGLSTVYGIVKQSKGNIWVYSEPGKGSTFKIYLPRVKKTIRIMERPGKKEESLQGSETILVVEDDDMVRELAINILKRYGYTVLFAGDGQEAFHICRGLKEPVQLMLTDVVMPRISGRELVESLEGMRPEMKVLFMSGYTDNAIVHHWILDNRIAFIQKPFTPGDLARKVREVLDT
jgi:CheY-like chemotaxis protein